MNFKTSSRFDRIYKKMHANLQDAVDDTIDQILEDPYHPSLQTAPVTKARNDGVKPPVSYSRVNKGIRITWQILKDEKGNSYYFFRNVGEHDPTLDNY
jgi:hypothetical protein